MKKKKRRRPKGTGKPEGEKYILKTFRFPPDLWEAFSNAVPRNQWSVTIRGYMEKEITRRAKAAK